MLISDYLSSNIIICIVFFDLTYFRAVGQKYTSIFVHFLVQMKTSKSHSEINWPLIGFTVASCFFLCRRIFSVLLTRSFRSAFFVLSLFLVEDKENSVLQSLEFGFILLLLLLQKKEKVNTKLYTYVVRQNFVSVASHNFFGRFSRYLLSIYIILQYWAQNTAV